MIGFQNLQNIWWKNPMLSVTWQRIFQVCICYCLNEWMLRWTWDWTWSLTTRFRIHNVKPWNGFWKRMDFQLEWIEILNFMISKILIEKMILILNIGMNLKTLVLELGLELLSICHVCHKNLREVQLTWLCFVVLNSKSHIYSNS